MNKQNQLFYIVKGTLYRNSEFDEENLININREFKNKDPRQARKDAFSYYVSVLEVLLESLGLKYENCKQAEKELKKFYTSNQKTHFKLLPEIAYNNDVDKLLVISFCIDETKVYKTKTGIKIYDNERIIKAIGYESHLLHSRIRKNLKIEQGFFKQSHF